jgi:hypothetical protein
MAYAQKKTRARGRTTAKRTGHRTRVDQARINIFVSYAREDDELVARLVALLSDTFKLAPLSILRDVEIKQGVNYQSAIENALDKTSLFDCSLYAKVED